MTIQKLMAKMHFNAMVTNQTDAISQQLFLI